MVQFILPPCGNSRHSINAKSFHYPTFMRYRVKKTQSNAKPESTPGLAIGMKSLAHRKTCLRGTTNLPISNQWSLSAA